MNKTHKLELILGLTCPIFLLILLLLVAICCCLCKSRASDYLSDHDIEKNEEEYGQNGAQEENLMLFHGGQDLTIFDILEAPGEVIGKSDYGTLYKAFLRRSDYIGLLRFLRPVCVSRVSDFDDVVRFLGGIRHPNLVPLLGFYSGPRGEKLLVYPYFRNGNLAQFIQDGNGESRKWMTIYNISLGVVKGLDHLHSGFHKPIVHGNLKSKNILLDRNNQPFVSDFGIHLLLNPTAAQEMLDASASEGYKAPELIKMREANEATDIYSLGVILLELISGKQPVNANPSPDEEFHLPTAMRNALLDGRLSNLCHPDVLLSSGDDNGVPVSEEHVLRFFELAISCCSPSPSHRPKIKQVLSKLDDIGR